jgi:hypothetical protein
MLLALLQIKEFPRAAKAYNALVALFFDHSGAHPMFLGRGPCGAACRRRALDSRGS